jgi:2-keto-4-pentenoate hydratase
VRLDQVVARITLNNKEIAVGTGDAVLGNPLNSVLWLAHKLTESAAVSDPATS